MNQLYINFFGAEESEAINVHFEAVGYESSDFLINAGQILLFTLMVPFYCIVTYILSKCCKRQKC